VNHALLTAAADPDMTACAPKRSGNNGAQTCRDGHPTDPTRWCAGCLIAGLLVLARIPSTCPECGASWL